MFHRACKHRNPQSIDDMHEMIVAVNLAKADLAQQGGYSPNMLAHGRRLAGLPSNLEGEFSIIFRVILGP